MPEPVSWGLGRAGPWLQNGWLRIESRLEDASISPVALDGPFRPAERAIARVRLVGGAALVAGRADYDVRPHADVLGRGRLLALTARAGQGAALLREVALYDDRPFLLIRLGVRNLHAAPLWVDALQVFLVPGERRGRVRLSSPPAHWRIYRNGWQSWSPAMSLSASAIDFRAAPPVLAPEPPLEGAGRFASDDVGVLHDPQSGRAVLAGCVTARDLMTQVVVDAPARSIDVRCLADGIAILPGETLWSEWIAVDVCGSPNDQLERYGEALGRLMSARVPASTPSGWCSWYYFYTQVTEGDVVRNLRFLEARRRELPIDTIQIDDGYQADIGDWLSANEKFPLGMRWLASQIRGAGYRPGLWLAPFLLAETSQTYAAHPDWVVHTPQGDSALATRNWDRACYGVDGSHPDARAWLRELLHEICDGWGYDYAKIDFLFGAAIAGRRHDAAATRVRAYRAALEAVREGSGDDRFILGCGALMAPSVGVFDGNRIGPDVGPWWRFLTREEREQPRARMRTPDDGLSAETAVRNAITRTWMHGRLWANDPDCILVRADGTKLTLDETRTLASVIGLTGGMALSSDDLPQLPPERVDLLSILLPPLGDAARPLDLMERDMPERLELVVERDFDPVRVVGLFNFDDDAKDLRHDLPDGRWHAFELWTERYLGVVDGAVSFPAVAPHACRVVGLRPVRDSPQLVATTAHIGLGILDITAQGYNATSRHLTLGVAPAGRRRRRIVVAGTRPTRSEFSGQAAELAPLGKGAWAAELSVEKAGELTIAFA